MATRLHRRVLAARPSTWTVTTRFTPTETVYASVITAGVGSGVIKVRWTYSGKMMGEPTKEVRGAAATEFHLQGAGGLPPGTTPSRLFWMSVCRHARVSRR